MRTAPCPHCGRAVDRTLYFCTHCGFKTGFQAGPHFCQSCGARVQIDGASFCTACGEVLRGGRDEPGLHATTLPRPVPPLAMVPTRGPRLVLLDDAGGVMREIPLERETLVVGRTAGDLTFDDDDALSPEHALLTWRENALSVRDLGSSNGSWLFVTAPQRLSDGDVLLVGSQVIRFRRLATRRTENEQPGATGSHVPVQDDAMLEQLRADGSVRDVLYLSPGRTILIGREQGDWVFPYDPTMSARHAEIRSVPDRDEYLVRDVGSRNGVAVLVRGERPVREGERLLLGHKMLRVDLR